jgi:hypothetical protein
MSNPEDGVIDVIDQLVNEQLRQESSGYDHNINQDRCTLCGGDWHGTAVPGDARSVARLDRQRAPGCPGAFASDEQRGQWKARQLCELERKTMSKLRFPSRSPVLRDYLD